jgi:hypothetical protein
MPRQGDKGDHREDDYDPDGMSTDELHAFVMAHCAQFEAERAARLATTRGAL